MCTVLLSLWVGLEVYTEGRTRRDLHTEGHTQRDVYTEGLTHGGPYSKGLTHGRPYSEGRILEGAYTRRGLHTES